MPRKPFTQSSEHFYHLGARTNNQEWFGLQMPVVWRIMSDYLFFIRHSYGVEILSFVLMSNHFHLIAKFPEGNLSEAMLYFMRETSRNIARSEGRINHVYGNRVSRSMIGSDRYLRHVYKYVYRNPVEARAVKRAEDYRYSTLNGVLGGSYLGIPLISDPNLFQLDTCKTLDWLNAEPESDYHDYVQRALSRPEFRLPRCSTSLKANPLEQDSY